MPHRKRQILNVNTVVSSAMETSSFINITEALDSRPSPTTLDASNSLDTTSPPSQPSSCLARNNDTVQTDETNVYQTVQCLKVAGTHVSLWLFPEHFIESPDSVNLFNSTSFTSFLLGHVWLSTVESLPEDAPLNHSWFSSIVYAIRVGITLANDSPNRARTLSLAEISSCLLNDRLIKINLFLPKPV